MRNDRADNSESSEALAADATPGADATSVPTATGSQSTHPEDSPEVPNLPTASVDRAMTSESRGSRGGFRPW